MGCGASSHQVVTRGLTDARLEGKGRASEDGTTGSRSVRDSTPPSNGGIALQPPSRPQSASVERSSSESAKPPSRPPTGSRPVTPASSASGAALISASMKATGAASPGAAKPPSRPPTGSRPVTPASSASGAALSSASMKAAEAPPTHLNDSDNAAAGFRANSGSTPGPSARAKEEEEAERAEQRRRRRAEVLSAAQSVRLRHNLLVQGWSLGWNEVVGKYDVRLASELEELLQVWHTQWHGFPAWQTVMAAREALSDVKEQGDVWARLRTPQRRMAAEVALWTFKQHNLYNEEVDKRDVKEERFVKAFLGLMDRVESRQAPLASGQQAPQSAGKAAASQGAAGQAFKLLPETRTPLFVTIGATRAFTQHHGLMQLGRQGFVPESEAQYVCKAHAPLDSGVCGRVHNLTTRQVRDWIVAPALEATCGMCYAEAYLHDPKKTSSEYVGMPHEKQATAILVPYPPDMDFCELVVALPSSRLLAGLHQPSPSAEVLLWLDFLCETITPGSSPFQSPSLGPARPPVQQPGAAEPAATTDTIPGSQAAGSPSTASRVWCKRVGLLVGGLWPWLPDQLPPSLADEGCVRWIAEARLTGMEPVLLARAFSDVKVVNRGFSKTNMVEISTANYCIPSFGLVQKAAEHLHASSGGGAGAPPAGLAGGDQAQAAAELWRLYVQDIQELVPYWGKYRSAASSPHDKLSSLPARVAGEAVLRVSRVLTLEAVCAPDADAAPAAGPGAAGTTTAAAAGPTAAAGGFVEEVLLELVLDEQVLRCPPDMSQAEADALFQVWRDQWGGLPSWGTVLRVRSILGGVAPGSAWSGMSPEQRRTACELVLLYGEGAATWRPSAEAVAAGRVTSSRGHFVSLAFLRRFTEMHGICIGGKAGQGEAYARTSRQMKLQRTLPGQDAIDVRAATQTATTNWVCANIVLPATKAYGMCYSDLYLSAEAHAALSPQSEIRFSQSHDTAPSRAFASHAWACPFAEFVEALYDTAPGTHYWIDIFLKNQWVSVAIHDLSDNLTLAGRVALVAHPFPKPLVVTRVWCLFELMTALQLQVPLKLHATQKVRNAIESRFAPKETEHQDLVLHAMSPELEADVAGMDVESAEATVAADRELILGMIRQGVGVEEMNRQVRDIFGKLVQSILGETNDTMYNMWGWNQVGCFAGNGLVVRLGAGSGGGGDGCSGGGGGTGGYQASHQRGKTASGGRRHRPLPWRHSAGSRASASGRSGGAEGCADGACRADTGAAGPDYSGAAGAGCAEGGRAFGDTGGGGGRGSLCRVADLRPGDRIVTAGGGVSTVVLVTVDPVGPEGMELCALPRRAGVSGCMAAGRKGGSNGGAAGSCEGGRAATAGAADPGGPGGRLLVTPDHPVLVDGVWRLPRDLGRVERMSAEQVPYGCIFNLELDPPASLEVSGVVLVSLGQDTSREAREGIDPASDALWGWGWRDNPDRRRQLQAQQDRYRRAGSELEEGKKEAESGQEEAEREHRCATVDKGRSRDLRRCEDDGEQAKRLALGGRAPSVARQAQRWLQRQA